MKILIVFVVALLPMLATPEIIQGSVRLSCTKSVLTVVLPEPSVSVSIRIADADRACGVLI